MEFGKCEDRLSSLPDTLLHSILSHLPTKTAISTCVLSTRWQHLYTHLTHLSFSGPHFPLRPNQTQLSELLSQFLTFITTISHVLDHLSSPKLTKFNLTLDLPITLNLDRFDALINSWVLIIFSRRPEDFSVTFHTLGNSTVFAKLPFCIFQCDTIVSLDLGISLVYVLPEDEEEIKINLPNIKKLEMFFGDKHRKLFKTLFKSCPLLEDLCLKFDYCEEGHVVEIFCSHLKRLDLRTVTLGFSPTAEFVIDAPKLENLSIESHSVLYRFVSQPCRLTNVRFGLWSRRYFDFGVDYVGLVSEVFKASSSVRFLDLGGSILKYIDAVKNKDLPVFHSLTELRINDLHFSRLEELMAFLRCCPNLEFIVLCFADKNQYRADEHISKWALSYIYPSFLFTKMRVLEMINISASKYVLKFVKYTLRNGSVLEKLRVCIRNYGDDQLREELKFCHKLFSCPKGSSACEIEFSGQYITASSKGFKDGNLDCRIHCANVAER